MQAPGHGVAVPGWALLPPLLIQLVSQPKVVSVNFEKLCVL